MCGADSDKRNPAVDVELAVLLLARRFDSVLSSRSASLPLTAAFGTWSRRVRFKNSDPVVDSSLVIMSTDVSDEGNYICRITTFPLGNFDKAMSVIVWSECVHHGCVVLQNTKRGSV